MRIRGTPLAAVTLTAAAAVVVVGTCLGSLETAGRDPASNLAMAQRWQKDLPDRYARLMTDLKTFDALPEDRKNRLRKLDADLFRRPSPERAQLWRVMERYTLWHESLPLDERQKLDALPPGRAKLEMVQSLRGAELLARLPADERDAVNKLATGPQRAKLWQELAEHRRQQTLDWQVVERNLKYLLTTDDRLFSRTSTAPPLLKLHITMFLRPLLTAEERARLDQAEGSWPRFPRVVAELVEKHEFRLPIDPTMKHVQRWDDLTPDTKHKLGRFPDRSRYLTTMAEGDWLLFSLLVNELARQQKAELVQKLGACSPEDFPKEVQHFIKRLPAEDQAELDRFRGRWPEYPRTLFVIAKQRHLEIPGKSYVVVKLPDSFRGSRGLGAYRLPGPGTQTGPQPTDKTLRDFLLYEINLEKRLTLQSSLDDRAGREEIRRLYFLQNPAEEAALRASDRQLKPDAPPH